MSFHGTMSNLDEELPTRDKTQDDESETESENDNTVYHKEEDGSYSAFCRTCRRLKTCPECGQRNRQKNAHWKVYASSDEEEEDSEGAESEAEDEETEIDPSTIRKLCRALKDQEEVSDDASEDAEEEEDCESNASEDDGSETDDSDPRCCKRIRLATESSDEGTTESD